MKIELLYPEITCLNGDLYNMEFLRRSVPNCGVAATSLGERPKFLDDDSIDLVYMGSMTEGSQLLVLDQLFPVREEIWYAIEDEQRFLITGNAMEIFGNKIIETGDMILSENGGEEFDCLGLFDFDVERNLLNRKNSLFLGEYRLAGNDAIQVVGFQSKFGHGIYGKHAPKPLFHVNKGYGFAPEGTREGLHYKNFMATYLLGPMLPLNPAFMVRLCWEMGYAGIVPAHMDAAMSAYRKRLYEYSDSNIQVTMDKPNKREPEPENDYRDGF